MARALNLDGIPHFLAVAEAGSFTAAAVRFGISPSAVSQAVRLLEHRLGTALFNRSTRSVALTTLYNAGSEPCQSRSQIAYWPQPI